jgi:8-oxo-dGTP pyrophosphatase MutT (NUDIX family)
MTIAAVAAPAATVVLARVVAATEREACGGGFEVYLVKRHGKSGFMAGAHVFPGGRVDDDDDAFAASTFAVAAIRETWEECGVLLARHESGLPLTTQGPTDAVTARTAAGEPFAHALRAAGLVPDVDALVPLAWWITPVAEPKRFDTRFFFAVVPPLQRHTASVDGHEVTEGVWLSPRRALERYRAPVGEPAITLAPPTLVTLEELARCATVDDVTATRWPTAPVQPVLHHADGLVLALPGDPLHDVATPVWPHRTRVVLGAHGRFESSTPAR